MSGGYQRSQSPRITSGIETRVRKTRSRPRRKKYLVKAGRIKTNRRLSPGDCTADRYAMIGGTAYVCSAGIRIHGYHPHPASQIIIDCHGAFTIIKPGYILFRRRTCRSVAVLNVAERNTGNTTSADTGRYISFTTGASDASHHVRGAGMHRWWWCSSYVLDMTRHLWTGKPKIN